MAPYHRTTRIPIKDGSIDGVVAIAKTPKFVAHIKTFVGFISVEVVADGASHMITHSRWRNKEACDGGVAALGSVLKGFLSEFLRGPPEAPVVGEEMIHYSPILGAGCLPAAVGNVVGDLLGKKKVARRLTHFALKPGPESLPAVLAVMNKPSIKELFRTLDMAECVGFSAGADSFSVCATCAAAASLPTLTPSAHPLAERGCACGIPGPSRRAPPPPAVPQVPLDGEARGRDGQDRSGPQAGHRAAPRLAAKAGQRCHRVATHDVDSSLLSNRAVHLAGTRPLRTT